MAHFPKFAATFAVVLLSLPVSYVPAKGDIVLGASTAVALEGIKGLINGAISKAENTGDYLAFRLGTELRLSIEAWEKSNSDLLDKTFSDLSVQQQAFLTGTDRIAVRLANEVGASLDKMEDISNQWQNLVSSTVIGDNIPVVSSYRPAIFRPIDADNPFRVSIKGANLNKEEPKLFVSGAETTLSGNTSVSLLFSIKGLKPEFLDDRTSLMQMDLTLYRPADNWFGRLIGRTEPMSFKLPVMIGPKSLGAYELIANYSENVERVESKSVAFSHSSGDVSNNCKIFNRGPSENGRSIKDVRVIVTRAGRASGHRLVSSNPQGFSVEICARRWTDFNLARIGSGPGDRHVRVDYVEYWTETVARQKSYQGEIEWEKESLEDMPDSTKSFVLKIKSFDGRQLIFTGSGKKSLFDVSYDVAGKQVTIDSTDPEF